MTSNACQTGVTVSDNHSSPFLDRFLEGDWPDSWHTQRENATFVTTARQIGAVRIRKTNKETARTLKMPIAECPPLFTGARGPCCYGLCQSQFPYFLPLCTGAEKRTEDSTSSSGFRCAQVNGVVDKLTIRLESNQRVFKAGQR